MVRPQPADRSRTPGWRRPLVAAVAMLAVAGATGCGVGHGNETGQEHAVVQATDVAAGNIQFNNIYITPVGQQATPPAGVSLAPADAPAVSPSPTPTTTISPGDAQAYLVATVTNSSNTATDRVLGAQITGAGGTTVNLAPPTAKLDVPPNGQLHFNDPAATSTGPFLVISGATTPFIIGTSMSVTFTVAGEGQLPPVEVPIISSFAGPPPSSPPVPTSSASPTTSASAKGKATGTASPSGTASGTPLSSSTP